MTEAVEPTSNSDTIAAAVVTPKLWAGKYKTPEEMEEAIKAKDNEYGKLYEEHDGIKKKYDEISKVPDKYAVPDGMVLRQNEIQEIEQLAKNAGLTQAQFEKTALDMQARIQSSVNAMIQAKEKVGQDKIAIIQDHIKKHYPESLQEVVFNKVLMDEKARTDILSEREKKLNSEVPGMDKGSTQGSGEKRDGDKELKEAFDAYHKNPSERTRKKYLDVVREVGEERYKDKV